ncbi:MAG: thioredoxin family protein [Chloroflexota bacterium]|nr:thioredoxin family protein [Chloroflexota bacterium]MDE2961943.1 thioredoxin family protein [Chloroflexota bacterium]
MVQEASVVTPERYSQGMTYDQYMETVKVNKARIEEYYSNVSLDSDQTARLQELASRDNGPSRMMVIGEDWCGDVVRELPVLARVAEAAGLELRIFPRDENHDIMNEFLKEGLYMSIPVAVFYDRGHEYICHWIERSEAANREQGEIEAAIRSEQPDISDQDFGRQRRARTAARAGDWQKATVDELVGLLQEHLH